MKIALKPFDHFVPGRGKLRVTDAEVTIGQYELGGRIRGNYDLRALDPASEAKREISVGSGHIYLTDEQRAAWHGDDQQLARTIVLNAGLEPA